jgi:hypothetical protein
MQQKTKENILISAEMRLLRRVPGYILLGRRSNYDIWEISQITEF